MAAGASTSGSDRDEGNDGPAFAQNGDVVEFPLSPATRERMNDGREKGVGFIVGRNIGRFLFVLFQSELVLCSRPEWTEP